MGILAASRDNSEKYGALHKEFIEEESKEITISSPKPHSVLQRS
jgi:hypothetical protein